MPAPQAPRAITKAEREAFKALPQAEGDAPVGGVEQPGPAPIEHVLAHVIVQPVIQRMQNGQVLGEVPGVSALKLYPAAQDIHEVVVTAFWDLKRRLDGGDQK